MTSFLERFFPKAISSEITYEDFLNFRKQNIEEHQYLDYKSGEILVGYEGQCVGKDGKLTTDEGFLKLAAVVAGFANAEGGLLVLGIRELQEKIHGKIVKKRPGAVYALPEGIITKEMIESKLRALIRFPIDDLTLVPLRSSSKSKHFVCLIDIPQSIRAPHRVNEQEYYQRYNFETRLMLHYQISDLFGKRFAPNLDLQIELADVSDNAIKLKGVLYNYGRALAKYPMCIWEVTNGQYDQGFPPDRVNASRHRHHTLPDCWERKPRKGGRSKSLFLRRQAEVCLLLVTGACGSECGGNEPLHPLEKSHVSQRRRRKL